MFSVLAITIILQAAIPLKAQKEWGLDLFSGFFPIKGRYSESVIFPFDLGVLPIGIFHERFSIRLPYFGIISWNRLELFSTTTSSRIGLTGFFTVSGGIGAGYWFPAENFKFELQGAVIWFRPIKPHIDRFQLASYLKDYYLSEEDIIAVSIENLEFQERWMLTYGAGMEVKYYFAKDKYASINFFLMYQQEPQLITGTYRYVTGSGGIHTGVPFDTGNDLRWDWRIIQVGIGGGASF